MNGISQYIIYVKYHVWYMYVIHKSRTITSKYFRFTKTVPDLRRIVDTLSTLIKMAFKVKLASFSEQDWKQTFNSQIVDKIEGTPDRVEVETGQLIFKVKKFFNSFQWSSTKQFTIIHYIVSFWNSQLFNDYSPTGYFHKWRGAGVDCDSRSGFSSRGDQAFSSSQIDF